MEHSLKYLLILAMEEKNMPQLESAEKMINCGVTTEQNNKQTLIIKYKM